MQRLLIDLNSILTASLLVGKDRSGTKVDGQLIPTADYGVENFAKSLAATLQTLDMQPYQIVGVYDAPGARQRRQVLFPAYKTHRQKRPDEYYQSFAEAMARVRKLITGLGGTCVSAARTEADDVIAFLGERLPDATIWSRDKDMLFCKNPVYIDGKVYSTPSCEDKFAGMQRRHIPLYRSIVGDPGDFGKGMSAQGFGEKAFVKMRAIFGEEGLDKLCEALNSGSIDELQTAVQYMPELQKILNSKQNVLLVWRLAQHARLYSQELRWEAGLLTPLHAELREEERCFMLSYGRTVLVTADNFDNLKISIERDIAQSPFIALDIETDVYEESLDWIKAIQDNVRKDAIKIDVVGSVLVGMSISTGLNGQNTYYFSVEHADTPNIRSEDLRDFLMPLLAHKRIVCHRAAGFELPVLYLNWGVWLPNVHCSKILAQYVNENHNTGLKELSKDLFAYEQITYEQVTGGKGMAELTGDHVLQYGCEDALCTFALYNFGELFCRVERTFDVYAQVESDSQYLTARATAIGFKPDLEALAALEKEDQEFYDQNYATVIRHLIRIGWPGSKFEPLIALSVAEIKRGYFMLHGEPLKTQVRKIEKLAAAAGGEYGELLLEGDLEKINSYLVDNFTPTVDFNTKSTKQTGELLYGYLWCPVRFSNMLTEKQRADGQEVGNNSTDNDAIKWAKERDVDDEDKELLQAIINCRASLTRKSLFYSRYKYFKHWKTGRVHSNLQQSSTASRRFAPSAPNVNQLPKRFDKDQGFNGKRVRRVVGPHRPGALIVSPDETGQELRIMADSSQDPAFLACYIGDNKKDLHSLVGTRIYGQSITYEQFIELKNAGDPHAKLCRDKGKSTNFLAQYLGTAPTLSKKLIIDEDEAQEMLDARAATFPTLIRWSEDFVQKIHSQGYALTKMGARKHIQELIENGGGLAHILRSGLNSHIQGSAAEMTKLVMGSVQQSGILDRYDCEFYFPVHDEFVFSVWWEDLAAFCYELRPMVVQQYADMVVPLESDLSVGPNFADMTGLDWPTSMQDEAFIASVRDIVEKNNLLQA